MDGGLTWTLSSTGTFNSLSSLCFPDAITGYAVGNYGTILKTTDGGNVFIGETGLPGTSFTLFPNPANRKVVITDNFKWSGETSVTLFGISGKQLMHFQFRNRPVFEIDVNSLSNGLYLLRIETPEAVESKKLLIQH
jgi:hypothetical protein